VAGGVGRIARVPYRHPVEHPRSGLGYHRDAVRPIQPRDQRGVHRPPRGGVFANRSGGTTARDKQSRSRHGDANPNPVISEAFTVAPEVVYSPIVPLEFATNRVDPDTAMPA